MRAVHVHVAANNELMESGEGAQPEEVIPDLNRVVHSRHSKRRVVLRALLEAPALVVECIAPALVVLAAHAPSGST